MYWAKALATQDKSSSLKTKFAELAKAMTKDESKIVDELNAVQGKPVDIGGYFMPDCAKTAAAMRPSKTLNDSLATLS